MKKKGNFFVYMVLVAAVLLTKVLGLVRNMMLSACYGTSVEASAFIAVSNLPLIIFDVTFGTAISAAFVPVFNEKLTSEGEKNANKFASNFITIVLAFSAVIVILGIIFPEVALSLVASGFENSETVVNLATSLIRIIMPIICFACCTFIFIGILQSYGEFIAPALVSLFSNLSMIFYLLFFNSSFGIEGLAVAFCFGWFLQFAFLLPFLKKKRFKYTFRFDIKSPDIKKVAILTLPLFVSSLAQPINQLISSNFSSTVSHNAIATVNYAYNAYFIVAGVFSYALTNMFFPEMSRKFASKDIEGATYICKDMLSTITAIIIPIMAVICSCSKPIIKVLYERGEFTTSDTNNVAVLLSIYTLGMLFLSWQDILNKYFYSMQKSFIPMIAAAAGIAVNFILSLILISILGINGLAISTVVSGFLMTAILSLFTFNYTKSIFKKDFVMELIKILVSGVSVYFLCLLLLKLINVYSFGTLVQTLLMAAIFIVSVLFYFLALLILKSNNLSKILKLFKKEGKPNNV